jgi:RNA polymerase sigma-70 factor (ECF subfamily)
VEFSLDTDAELVKAACDGDVDSFRQLYERYYRLAVSIARSRLNDRHLAEDAAQEAFATACRTLAGLRNPSRFPEWLGTICRRTASRMARSRVGSNGKPLAKEPASPTAPNNAASNRIHEALARLTPDAREVLQLHYFAGLTYEQIARALGISPQAVHGRMQRARHSLAGWLKIED